MLFLLTRPVRGATYDHAILDVECKISTHTPRAGRDFTISFARSYAMAFLLTRPVRGATDRYQKRYGRTVDFYSHAPCGARHKWTHKRITQMYNFYSHAPCGARHSNSGTC